MENFSKLKKILDVEAMKQLWKYSRPYKRDMIWVVLLSITSSLLSVYMAFVTKDVIDSAVSSSFQIAFSKVAILAAILLFEMLLSSYISYYSVRVTEKIRNTLQYDLLHTIYGKCWLEVNRYQTGDLLTRLQSDISSLVTVLISTIPRLIALMVQLITAFFFLCYYDTLLATLTFLITPITILISMVIGSKLKIIQRRIQQADALKNSILNESLQNILILKAYRYLENNLQIFKKLQASHFELVKDRNVLAIKSNFIIGLGYRLGFFGAIAFGAYRLSYQAISFGTFTAFLQLVGQIQGPLVGLSQSLPQLISTLSSVERLDEISALKSDESPVLENRHSFSKPVQIDFKELAFSYNGKDPVLHSLNLTIKKGEKIALIGSSGEGKTTLIHLLMAMMQPDSGTMTITEEDGSVTPLSSSTRHYFAYVPQSNALFSGSILSNFLLTEDVPDAAIEEALMASCSKEFVDQLKDGVHTLHGERGIGLSQGQAQRLTIARALLHKTPFLVFDEATSALDLDTEKELISNLRTYYPDVTLIAVTHRESIFEICDRVYRLKGGSLHEETPLHS